MKMPSTTHTSLSSNPQRPELSAEAMIAMGKALPIYQNPGADLSENTWLGIKKLAIPEQTKNNAERKKKWHEIEEKDLTPEQIREMRALELRAAISPDGVFASIEWDPQNLPRNVHFGQVIEGTGEFFSARIPKKNRSRNLVDDLIRNQKEVLESVKERRMAIDARIDATSFKRRASRRKETKSTEKQAY